MSANPSPDQPASPVPGADPAPTRAGGQMQELSQTNAVEAQGSGSPSRHGESRRDRSARNAHRTRLYLYALGAVAVLVYVVGLAASNTRHVKVDWVFGSSSVRLVWLVLFAAILGWLLGVLVTALFRWRTRAPRAS
jgi:uncharacterized integral membrane protein